MIIDPDTAALNGESTSLSPSDDFLSALQTMSKKHKTLAALIPHAAKDGNALRWGLASALQGPIDAFRYLLSEIGGDRLHRKRADQVDWLSQYDAIVRRIDASLTTVPSVALSIDAVLWAYAIGGLQSYLSESHMLSLVASLRKFALHSMTITDPSDLARLIGGGELALVLAWKMPPIFSDQVKAEAASCITSWCENPEASIGFAVTNQIPRREDSFPSDPASETSPDLSLSEAIDPRVRGPVGRLVIASLIRSEHLLAKVCKIKLSKVHDATLYDLATWIAAESRVGGTCTFSAASARDVRDDVIAGGLLDLMKRIDRKTLSPAIDAALGVSQTGGRLAWEISLPESMHHSELAGSAIMLPEWDVRRGRTQLDYSGEHLRLQVDAGKSLAIDGHWEAMIDVDGHEQAPTGSWVCLCEYTDDDVHYLELEQRWTGNVKLQRHVMLLREDRCVMLADAVIPTSSDRSPAISYLGRIPLAHTIQASPEVETNEIWLVDAKGTKRGLAIPLQCSEWRVGPTRAKCELTADHHLRLEMSTHAGASHGGALFVPVWLDFQQRRFSRPRTWRQLTVAEELRIVQPDESVAFRIQQGSEQWVVYRMLNGDSTRTFLGKHLLADLYCARFHPSDGSMEDLVTVGGIDDEDESE